jgi:predicted Zn-dependent protease
METAMQHFRFSRLAVAGVIVAMLAACATSPTGRSQLILKDEEELEAQGEAAFTQLRAEMPLSTDRATIDFVACVANAIVGQLEGEMANLNWELAVVDRPEVNAFVLPGGKITVFTGLLGVTENDDQLAAVMGHEVAHVTARHPNERASRAVATGYTVGFLSAIVGGTYMANQSASTAIQMAAQLGVTLPFTRLQEREADIVGIDYMARAGFDPRESVALWKNMQKANENEPPEFLSTHPSSDDRIDKLVAHYPVALKLYNEAKSAGKTPDCGARPAIKKPES